MIKTFTLVFIGSLFFSTSLSAQPFDTTISLDVGSDEQDNTNSMLSVDMLLSDNKNVFFGFGNSKTPSGNEVIENEIAYVGLSKQYNKDWKLTGTLEHSGLKDSFSMFSISGGMRFIQDDFYAEIIPGIRNIKLTTLSDKNVHISSGALGFKAGVYLGDYFRLSGSTYSYNYSRDVSVLASFASTQFFNVKTLLLSSGLLESSRNIELGADFDSFSVSFGKNSSTSAIDFAESDYVYSVFDYYFSDAWSASLLLGEYLDTPDDRNNYSSLTVSYSF